MLCGGSGTRLWPASRAERPKQFLALTGERSLFQDTVERVRGVKDLGGIVVVAGRAHVAALRRQLAEIGTEAVIIAEPEGRDSAPAIAVAALWIRARDPEGVAVVTASDHHIPDAAAFCAAADLAVQAALRGAIVSFGVRPTRPATGYGYIEPGAPFAGLEGVFEVSRFIEKPDEARAREYLDAGFHWNSGNFVFRASALIEELSRFEPDVVAEAKRALEGAERSGEALVLGEAFRSAPRISIDYALMERTARAAVAPVAYAWSDLGAWAAVHEASAADEAGNAVQGDAVLLDSEGCLIRSATGQTVAAVGLDGIGVIVEPDAVLVCDLASSQGVKQVVEVLKARDRPAAPAADPEVELERSRARFRTWLFASALPLWWTLGADHRSGGFHESLDLLAQPTGAPRRLRVQARQVHVYATAVRLGWPGPALDAVKHGLRHLAERHLRPDGLYRTLVSADGAPLNDEAVLYDQAFVILALASAAQALPSRRAMLEAQAEELLAVLEARFRHGSGGFREAASTGRPFQSNAHMHLFEAALTWAAERGPARFAALADELAELALARFLDPDTGALREAFDAGWRPAPGLDGRIIEPGHQFEWAWLLEQWGRLRSSAKARAAARRLFEVGEAGVDPVRGVAQDALLDDLSVHAPGARLWPQTERLKAASILSEAEGDGPLKARCLAAAGDAAAALGRYLDTGVPGLWRDRLDAAGAFVEEPAPASSFYHLIAAVAELGGTRIVQA